MRSTRQPASCTQMSPGTCIRLIPQHAMHKHADPSDEMQIHQFDTTCRTNSVAIAVRQNAESLKLPFRFTQEDQDEQHRCSRVVHTVLSTLLRGTNLASSHAGQHPEPPAYNAKLHDATTMHDASSQCLSHQLRACMLHNA